MFFMANENINMLIWFITLLLISLFMFVGSCSGKLFSALINFSSSVFLVFFSRGRGLQKYVKWKMWLVRLWLIDAHLLTCREAEQPHAKNCTVAENCTETLHHVFCTFEAEEFIYLVLFFILLRTKQQQVIWQKYSCLIMFENLIKNMLKFTGSSFSAERRFYIW